MDPAPNESRWPNPAGTGTTAPTPAGVENDGRDEPQHADLRSRRFVDPTWDPDRADDGPLAC
ncbi:hypothetical protein [Kitasatospora griseola]|uniref:hypothetical protein n=1 Tax=Kitasatospora griseola TaxID=2064 RepID=UPI003425C3EB